jgi:hypothetical protein
MIIYNVLYREVCVNELDEGTSSSSPRQRWELVAFSVIVIAAFITRLWPLAFSSYPFNNDGLTECTLASQILASGHMSILPDGHLGTTHSTAIPAMNIVIAYASSALGVDPYKFIQILIAVISLLTISGIYVLGRRLSGDVRGGIASALMGVMMGTFVFTTGSAWKEAFGFGLIALLLIAFIWRNEPRYRILCIATLMVLPLVHHLVAVIALLMVAYPVIWGWYFALSKRSVRLRHWEDLAMVGLPAIWLFVYYTSVSLDSFESVLSKMGLLFIIVAFVVLSFIQIAVLSIKTHLKLTFAAIPGAIVIALSVLDYYGYFFPYRPTAPLVSLMLIITFGVFVSIAWYGTEFAMELRHRYRAVHFGLLLAPATVIGFSILEGFTLSSQKALYRSFDFVDLFIFMGVGLAISSTFSIRKRAYPVLAFVMIILLAMSFPFGYYSDQTLGVRHDTQSYEVDAIKWLSDSSSSPQMKSDERIAYIGYAIADIPMDNGLVPFIVGNITLPHHWFVAFDDSYFILGVNDFPSGFAIIPSSNSTKIVSASDILYIGGPHSDRITMIATSNIGHEIVLGPIMPS